MRPVDAPTATLRPVRLAGDGSAATMRPTRLPRRPLEAAYRQPPRRPLADRGSGISGSRCEPPAARRPAGTRSKRRCGAVRCTACPSIGRRSVNTRSAARHESAGADALREETPVFDWAGETARRVGSLVHAELQVMDLERSDEAAIRARDAHFKRWLALHGVPDERLHDASARVIAALIGVHRDPRGRWILQEAIAMIFANMPYPDIGGARWCGRYSTEASSMSTGFAGSSITRRASTPAAVWRSFWSARSSATARSCSATRCWRKNLGPEPVRVGLYFPLMRAWREWSRSRAYDRSGVASPGRLQLAARRADRPRHLSIAGSRRIVPGVRAEENVRPAGLRDARPHQLFAGRSPDSGN